ncbi:MAG: M23 family metallopeptidase [Pseudomonadota bacterium]
MGIRSLYHWDRLVVVIISSLWAQFHVDAAMSCSEDWICIETKNNKAGVNVYAVNKRPFPATVSVRVKGSNLKPRNPSVTRAVQGKERLHLITLERVNANRNYDYEYRFDWAIGDANATPDDYIYALPYAPGQSYRVLQGFGSKFSHQGLEQYAVDFDMDVGTPVHAARPGTVTDVVTRHNRGCWQKGCGKHANFIVISHRDGTTGEYYHLKKDGAVVSLGDVVERGQLIGYSGNTGHTTTPHLHFAVYRPTSWGKTQSLPFKFEAARGIIPSPRPGRKYIAK